MCQTLTIRMMNNFEDLIEKEYSNIAGIAIRKDNHLIYEKYFDGYTPDDALHIASVTKVSSPFLLEWQLIKDI